VPFDFVHLELCPCDQPVVVPVLVFGSSPLDFLFASEKKAGIYIYVYVYADADSLNLLRVMRRFAMLEPSCVHVVLLQKTALIWGFLTNIFMDIRCVLQIY
jgi:hypothetical protein